MTHPFPTPTQKKETPRENDFAEMVDLRPLKKRYRIEHDRKIISPPSAHTQPATAPPYDDCITERTFSRKFRGNPDLQKWQKTGIYRKFCPSNPACTPPNHPLPTPHEHADARGNAEITRSAHRPRTSPAARGLIPAHHPPHSIPAGRCARPGNRRPN
jgi:hypothetical protein